MKKTLEWTQPALHLVQKALVAAVAIIAAVGLFAMPVAAFAADSTSLDAPVHHKTAVKSVTFDEDGTIDITLNVTGNSIQHSETSQADVIVVMDLSFSMTQRTGGWRSQTRLQVAKSAVNSLAQKLLSNNTTTNQDAVHLSLVTFGGAAEEKLTDTSNLSAFQSAVNGLSAFSGATAAGGTNWEDALVAANNVSTRENASVYIIFVSDGNPTYRDTEGDGGDGSDYINGKYIYGSGYSDYYGYNYDYAEIAAKSITNAGKTLYSVGVFGDATNMQNLATDAGQPNNYYSASNSDALNRAFNNIVKNITTDVSYTGVSISDTINADAVSFYLPNGATEPDFTYTKDGQTWTDAPKASVSGNAITWDLSSVKTLDSKVTYSVSFKVQLTQTAYDKAAAGDKTFSAYDADNSSDDSYNVFTNSGSDLTYSVISTVSDGSSTTIGPKHATYETPHVEVPVSTLHITKTWDSHGATLPTSLSVNVMRDDEGTAYKTVMLNADSWSADVKVAAGPTGHTYRVVEDMSDLSDWESSSDRQSVSFVSLAPMSNSVDLTNAYKTGTLKLTKNVKGNTANTNEEFTFTLTCEALAGKTYGDFQFNDKGVATVTLRNGDTKSGADIPTGSQIAIAEISETQHAQNTTYVTVTEDGKSLVNKQETKDYTATIAYQKTAEVTYTNQSQIVPDTGLDISTTSQGVLLGVAAAGAATLAAAAIRKNHGERKEK